MMPRKTPQRGYSLVEVLVAFVILATALAVILRIFSGGLRNTAASSEYARAAMVAETRLAVTAAELQAAAVSEGIEDGKYRWTRSVRPYVPHPAYRSRAGKVAAWQVDVSVEWPGGRDSRRIDVSTIRLAEEGETG